MKKEIQIPQELPQFNENQTLIIVSGKFSANFYQAFGGTMKEMDSYELHPRREGRDKHDGMVKNSGGVQSESYSHKERYIEDLKNKSHKQMTDIIHNLITPNKSYEIILISPKYCAKKNEEAIKKGGHKDVTRIIYGEHTKDNMHKILELIQKDIQKTLPDVFSEEELAIMEKPETRP